MVPQPRHFALISHVAPERHVDWDVSHADRPWQASQAIKDASLSDGVEPSQKRRERLPRCDSRCSSLMSVPEDGQFDVTYTLLLVGKAAAGLPEELAGKYEDAYLLGGDSVAKERGKTPSAAIFCDVKKSTHRKISGRRSPEEACATRSSSVEMQSAEVLLHVAAKPCDDVPEFSSHADALNAVAVFVVRLPRPEQSPQESTVDSSAMDNSDVADLDDQLSQITYFTQRFFWKPKQFHPSLNVVLLLGHGDAEDQPLPPQVEAFCAKNPSMVMHASSHADVKFAISNITGLIPACIARREQSMTEGKPKSCSLIQKLRQKVVKLGSRLHRRHVNTHGVPGQAKSNGC